MVLYKSILLLLLHCFDCVTINDMTAFDYRLQVSWID